MAIAQKAATDVGLDADALMACVDGGEFTQKVKDQMAFGQGLGVTGTPGNIVINNETLDTQKISGAVPATAFDAAIGGIIN
jgi:predicted DsbA family dithiol-disulfide isomerase